MENPTSSNHEQNDDEQESVESEENEPKLKYIRIKNDLERILSKDAVSCVAVHPKFVCVGTLWGIIHLLDHQGNSIQNKELRAHTVAVNEISIDANGDHIASCSDDGKVFVYGLYNSDNNHDIQVGRLVRSVAIDPNYFKSGSGRRFITGDDRLTLYEKTFLTRMRTTQLCDAGQEGGVKKVLWAPGGELIAWASHLGFRVFDITSRSSLGLIKWSRTPEVDVKCHLCWKEDRMVIVGWADTIRVCAIHKKNAHVSSSSDTSPYLVQLVYTFQTEFTVCGVGPLGSWLVVLGAVKDSERPQLFVIEPATDDYTILSTDSLTLRGYQQYTAMDYTLDCLVEESRYVIVSPKDIVVACPYDVDDRVDWLLEHRKFETALEVVGETDNGTRHSTLSVGRAYLDHLLTSEEYHEAAKLCRDILGRDKILWEKEVFKFARVHQLRAISRYLPLGEDRLSPQVYEMVLYEYLKMDPPEGFLGVVKEWPSRLYNVPAVVNAVLEHILVTDPKGNPTLVEALAILYSHDGKHEKALAMYIKIQNKGVFQLIRKHNLYASIHHMIEGLMALDSEQTIATLLESKLIDPEMIVRKLSSNKYYLYLYLDALDKKDTKLAQKHHKLLVRLYSDFAREKLLALLQRSDHYPIQDALDICKERMFHPEMVYLLGRIGNTKEALSLITKELGNIEKAIDFCKEHDDQELWEDLITYSLSKPSFITFLLKRIGTYVDPRILVQRIESQMEIPGLKSALVKMMQDYNLQVSVQEGCKKILVSDYFNLHQRLVVMHHRGTCIGDEQFCGTCLRKVLLKGGKDVNQPSEIVLFHCNHLFHTECLPKTKECCPICTSQKHTGSSK